MAVSASRCAFLALLLAFVASLSAFLATPSGLGPPIAGVAIAAAVRIAVSAAAVRSFPLTLWLPWSIGTGTLSGQGIFRNAGFLKRSPRQSSCVPFGLPRSGK